MDEWEDPGEPQPWGHVAKDPYKLIRQDVAKLYRAKIISRAEARYALSLPPLVIPADRWPPPPQQRPPRPSQRLGQGASGEAVGRAAAKAVLGLLSGPRRRQRRAGGYWIEHRVFHAFAHKTGGRH